MARPTTAIPALAALVVCIAPAVAAPVSITAGSYTHDIVVETGGVFGAGTLTATMDGFTALTGNTWYQTGHNVGAPTTGVPMGTTVVSAASGQTFTFASAIGNNAVVLNSANTSRTINFTTPTNYAALYLYGATGSGSANLTVTLNLDGGGTLVVPGTRSMPDWFANTPIALTANGRINSGGYSDVNGGNPRIYEAAFNTGTTAGLSGITLTWSGTGNTAVFAVGGIIVPEPSTVAWLVVGGLGLLGAGLRRHHHRPQR